ncbi:MAG: NifB/NifX family molybdenum-iron cluster-binding protein [Christensenellaceae bacterium]|nr:NifB/NifX family molybdenum-iron cluster-binding protein [Christensenellaceae bacterium]MEA5064686.1 NifB/NifX family molybdenum-iron cluster-binding protein [Eubacteriales bacterium]MEA5067699.1 NifB/NifX family molybdenum-iron cluster-binding protein [Christensenellaceae bacterium]
MIIAIPVNEDRTTVCPSFGRAPYFWVADTQSGGKSILENAAARSESGAGIRAAQAVMDAKADALVAPRLGENAANVLKAAGVKLYVPASDGAQANVDALLSGSLEPLTQIHPGFHHGGR